MSCPREGAAPSVRPPQPQECASSGLDPVASLGCVRKVLLLGLLGVLACSDPRDDGDEAEPTCEGDKILRTQADFAALVAENCSELPGDLVIQDNSTIDSLLGLESLTVIRGRLELEDADGLETLAGLQNLVSADSLLLTANDRLTTLSDLTNLTSVVFLSIAANPSLRDLRGLEGLSTVSEMHFNQPSFLGENGLTSLTGLENLASVTRGVSIQQMGGLASLEGLAGLTTVGGQFTIRDCDLLADLHGLENLASVGQAIMVEDNDALASLNGLQSIVEVGHDPDAEADTKFLWIQNHPLLTSLDPLHAWPATAMAANIVVQDNPRLPQCDVDAFVAEQTHPEATSSDTSPGNGTGTCN